MLRKLRFVRPSFVSDVTGKLSAPIGFATACFICASIAGAVLLGLIAPERTATGLDKLVVSTTGVFLVFVGLAFARCAARARGVLVRIDQNGLWDHRISTTTIPWSAVIDIVPVRLNRTFYVVLHLRPSFEKGSSFQVTTTIRYRFRRFFGYLGVYVQANDLQCRFADLLSACQGELHSFRCRHPQHLFGFDSEADPSEMELSHARERTPWVTFITVVILVFVFLAEFSAMPNGASNLQTKTLHEMGALDRFGIADQEYWRFFTAPALHASFGHLFANCIALLLAGYLLEPVVGATAMVVIFAICTLFGGLASVWLNPGSVVSVGASGGIIGLMTFAFYWAFTYPPGAMRSAFLIGSGRVLLPTIIGMFVSHSGAHIDHAAHLGGGIAGVAIAALWSGLLRPQRSAWPGKS